MARPLKSGTDPVLTKECALALLKAGANKREAARLLGITERTVGMWARGEKRIYTDEQAVRRRKREAEYRAEKKLA